MVEEIQRLKEIEKRVNSYELLNENQILALIRLKEVFKYVAHQTAIEKAHKQVQLTPFRQVLSKTLEIPPK